MLITSKLILPNGSKWVKEIKPPTLGCSLLPGSCLAVSHGRWAWPGASRPVSVLQRAALAAMQEPCSCSRLGAGGMALPAEVPVHEKGEGEVWSEGLVNLLLSHPCRCSYLCFWEYLLTRKKVKIQWV